VRNARRVKDGDRIDFGAGVSAIASDRGGDGAMTLDFEGEEPVELLLERAGRMPLPPYIAGAVPPTRPTAPITRRCSRGKRGRWQRRPAALHFTPALMEALAAGGVEHATLTLHVGAGTFLPMKAEDTADHVMHAEWGRIDAATADRLNATRARGGRVVAVGTTSLRLIESAAGEDGVVRPFEGDTAIFITPGYRFRGIDGLLTNFHLPKSTLFMLVSALMGLERMQAAYAHAIAQGYRFYSYGDACLLLPAAVSDTGGRVPPDRPGQSR
jgi:S-adenosylmethionine:tRNA ribosyltransferase-isomerase